MIFITVGAQMPFDRLVRAVDQWAGRTGHSNLLAQVGDATYLPQHFPWVRFLQPQEFRQRIKEADVVVAHAGMGSILTALELGKPILVMPRHGSLKETRNDHQVATAKQFLAQGRINVAFDEVQLQQMLGRLSECHGGGRIASAASPALIATLRTFLHAEGPNTAKGDMLTPRARPGLLFRRHHASGPDTVAPVLLRSGVQG